ncbi:MAG TPA: GNAT family N-acetyltransferase [Thermomicrobiales bacterium]|nr:GNAT family N-acetyltransferase [Thermomicrobiales bacterium]
MNDLAIHRIEPFRARDVAGAVARIYRDAYDYPVDDTMAFLNGAFARHATWPGFLLLIATVAGVPAGFVYGYESRAGQWWHDTIAPAMRAAEAETWLDDAFELAEIAVDPAVQGRGIGTSLITAFLETAPAKPVLLSTDAGASSHAASALYRRFGFVDILPDFRYPGFDDRAIIMGRLVPGADSCER